MAFLRRNLKPGMLPTQIGFPDHAVAGCSDLSLKVIFGRPTPYIGEHQPIVEAVCSLARAMVEHRPGRGVDLRTRQGAQNMGKGILMWLIGIPIPIILLILLFWH